MARPKRTSKLSTTIKKKEPRSRGRMAKACAQCRSGKTRCDFEPGSQKCNRCLERGIICEPLSMFNVEKGNLPKHSATPSTAAITFLSEIPRSEPTVVAKSPIASPAETSFPLSPPNDASWDTWTTAMFNNSPEEPGWIHAETHPDRQVLAEVCDVPFEETNELEEYEGLGLGAYCGNRNTNDSMSHAVMMAIGPQYQSKLGSASLWLPGRFESRNLIKAKILTKPEVVKLVGLFLGNFNHWIFLPRDNVPLLVDHILQKCSLLVTVCCSVALRFGSYRLWQKMYPNLVSFLWTELSRTLIRPPDCIEYVQALTILAKYADSLSFEDNIFDTWTFSRLGIQYLKPLIGSPNITYHRLWNNLVLAHLASANTTGRKSVLGFDAFESCSKIFEMPGSLNFDKGILAEIQMQWLTNQFLSRNITYEEYEMATQQWHIDWAQAMRLPIVHFVGCIRDYSLYISRCTHECRLLFANSDQEFSPLLMNSDTVRTLLKNKPSDVLLADMLTFNSIMSSILRLVEPKHFLCLRDSVRQTGFLSGLMGLITTKILIGRNRVTPVVREFCKLVDQLAIRFRSTSRGQDVAQAQCNSLLDLLDTVELPHPEATVTPTMLAV